MLRIELDSVRKDSNKSEWRMVGRASAAGLENVGDGYNLPPHPAPPRPGSRIQTCPKCGAPLVRVSGGWRCTRAGLNLCDFYKP